MAGVLLSNIALCYTDWVFISTTMSHDYPVQQSVMIVLAFSALRSVRGPGQQARVSYGP